MGIRVLVPLLALGAVAAVGLPSPRPAAAGPATAAAGTGAAAQVLATTSPARVPDPGELARRQLEALDTTRLDDFLAALNRETQGYLPPVGTRSALDVLRGGGSWEPRHLAAGLLRYAAAEVYANLGLLGRLVALAVLAAVLGNLHGAFEGNRVGELASAVVYLALAGVAVSGFHLAADAVRTVVQRLSDFMLAVLPLLTTLLAASGATVSAGLLHPLLVAAVQGVGILVSRIVLPLLLFSVVLDLVGPLSPRVRLTHLSGFLRQAALAVMGLGFAFFLGVMTVQGAAGAVADGVALRGAKFLAKSFVPVVGGMFADAVELVSTSSLLLRNALGIAGLLAVVAVAALPLVKVVVLVFVYRLAGALVEPVGATAIAQTLASMAGGLTLLAVAAGVAALMFFLAVVALTGIGNAVVMFR